MDTIQLAGKKSWQFWTGEWTLKTGLNGSSQSVPHYAKKENLEALNKAIKENKTGNKMIDRKVLLQNVQMFMTIHMLTGK